MEYRKRTRRRRCNRSIRPAGRDQYPAYLFAVLVFLAIVYVIGASKLGSYAAELWIAPAMARLADRDGKTKPLATPTPTPAPRAAVADMPKETTLQAELASEDWYAIQIGAYADQENAAAQAAALQQIGAAGFIVADGEHYRVLASCYETETEAKSVKTRLATEGVDSRIYAFSCAGKRISVTAVEERALAISEAFEGAPSLLNSIYALTLRFDKESMSIETALPLMQEIARLAENGRGALVDAASGNAGAYASFYARIAETIQGLYEETDRIACAARLKHCYLTAVEEYCRLQNQ